MKKFVFPSLPTFAEQVATCVTTSSKSADLVKWVEENEIVDTVAKFEGDGGEKFWTLVQLHRCREDNESIHLHVELHRSKPEGTASTTSRLSKAILTFLEMAQAEEVVDAYGRLRVSIHRRELPEYGAIAKLLNFRRKAGGRTLSMLGAILEIDDKIFDLMRFSYDAERENLKVDLTAVGTVELKPTYIALLVRLLTAGAENFVFEGVEKEQAHE